MIISSKKVLRIKEREHKKHAAEMGNCKRKYRLFKEYYVKNYRKVLENIRRIVGGKDEYSIEEIIKYFMTEYSPEIITVEEFCNAIHKKGLKREVYPIAFQTQIVSDLHCCVIFAFRRQSGDEFLLALESKNDKLTSWWEGDNDNGYEDILVALRIFEGRDEKLSPLSPYMVSSYEDLSHNIVDKNDWWQIRQKSKNIEKRIEKLLDEQPERYDKVHKSVIDIAGDKNFYTPADVVKYIMIKYDVSIIPTYRFYHYVPKLRIKNVYDLKRPLKYITEGEISDTKCLVRFLLGQNISAPAVDEHISLLALGVENGKISWRFMYNNFGYTDLCVALRIFRGDYV